MGVFKKKSKEKHCSRICLILFFCPDYEKRIADEKSNNSSTETSLGAEQNKVFYSKNGESCQMQHYQNNVK